MWLVTRYGTYSIADVRYPNGSIDPLIVMISARRVDHLSNLHKRFPALEDAEIVTAATRGDRHCRLFISKEVWALTVAELEQEQERWVLQREIMETAENQE